MTPRLGLCIACVGFIILMVCTAATIAEIRYEEGPPENSWMNHGVWMRNISFVWVPVAIDFWGTPVGNLALLYLLYAGGLLGLTVMAVGLAMAGAGARVQGGAPRIALCIAGVGLLIAVLCAGTAVILDDSELVIGVFFGGRFDATLVRQGLWLLSGFVGFNLIVVGLITAGVFFLTRKPGKPVASVARAIPGLLRIIPADDTSEMRADRRLFVEDTLLVTVDGHLGKTSADHCSASRSNLIGGSNVTTRQPVPVLPSHIEILFGELAQGSQRLAGGVV